jgi:hypothetical protein
MDLSFHAHRGTGRQGGHLRLDPAQGQKLEARYVQ